MAFLDRGKAVLLKVEKDVAEYGKVEVEPRMEGRYMRMMVAPLASTKKPVAKEEAPKPAQDGENRG